MSTFRCAQLVVDWVHVVSLLDVASIYLASQKSTGVAAAAAAVALTHHVQVSTVHRVRCSLPKAVFSLSKHSPCGNR